MRSAYDLASRTNEHEVAGRKPGYAGRGSKRIAASLTKLGDCSKKPAALEAKLKHNDPACRCSVPPAASFRDCCGNAEGKLPEAAESLAARAPPSMKGC